MNSKIIKQRVLLWIEGWPMKGIYVVCVSSPLLTIAISPMYAGNIILNCQMLAPSFIDTLTSIQEST